jgi:isocitrate/isopropylmalate dehydrogenase
MKLLVLPGDGIGPEITEATLEVLRVVDERLGLGLEFELHDIGLASLASRGRRSRTR